MDVRKEGTRNRRRGRPRLGENRKSEILRIRVTKAELRMLQEKAREQDCSVPDLLMKAWRQEE